MFWLFFSFVILISLFDIIFSWKFLFARSKRYHGSSFNFFFIFLNKILVTWPRSKKLTSHHLFPLIGEESHLDWPSQVTMLQQPRTVLVRILFVLSQKRRRMCCGTFILSKAVYRLLLRWILLRRGGVDDPPTYPLIKTITS
jgi:hypothetical protein